jgi:hypothetical protein
LRRIPEALSPGSFHEEVPKRFRGPRPERAEEDGDFSAASVRPAAERATPGSGSTRTS